jgi:hypothetical protein
MVIWPRSIKETAVRKEWFNRISKLPPGLDLPQASKMIRQPYAAVRRWGVLFGYKFPDRRRSVSKEQWNKVDWSERDADIARDLGVTRECVRLARRMRGMGPSAPQAATRELGHFILANAEKLHGLPVDEVLSQSGSDLPYYVCRRLLREHGIRPHEPQSPLNNMDWRLPNRDLAKIWGIDARYIANLRARGDVGPSMWNARNHGIHRNGKYAATLAAERQKVKKHLKT